MKQRLVLFLFVLLPMLGVIGTVYAWPEGKSDAKPKTTEVELTYAEAPKGVQATIEHWTKPDAVTEIEKITRGDITVYEIEYKTDCGEASLALAASGHLIESERPVKLEMLPEAVRRAVLKKHPGATIVEADAETMLVYDVEVTIRGKRHEIEVLASGEIQDADDDDDDEDDDDEDDDDEDDDEDDDDDDEDDDE